MVMELENNKPQMRLISVYANKEILDRVEFLAEKVGLSLNAGVVQILEKFVEENQDERG